jgi:hypothetical protein
MCSPNCRSGQSNTQQLGNVNFSYVNRKRRRRRNEKARIRPMKYHFFDFKQIIY